MKITGSAPLMEKQSFIKTGEPNLVNFNWTDLASGEGLINFYLCVDNASSALILSSSPLLANNSSFLSPGTHNFDTGAFNSSRVIQGTAYYVPSISVNDGTTGTYTIKLQLISGATTTDISNVISFSFVVASGSARAFLFQTALIPITSSVVVKKGDYVRAVCTVAGSGARLYINPGLAADTSTLLIPFRIDN